VAHCDSVTNRDRIELKWRPAGGANRILDRLRNFVEVNVTRHYLTETVGDPDERLADVGITQTACMKQAAMRRPLEVLLIAELSKNPKIVF
jgi:hypothetical protein